MRPPACQVFMSSFVMGCLCSGPVHRFQTRKCSFPCQGDRAEQEGKARRSQFLQALYVGSWKASSWRAMACCSTWFCLGDCQQCCKEGAGHPPTGKGLSPPTLGPAAPSPLGLCHVVRHRTDPGKGHLSQTTLFAGRAAASCGCFSLKGDCFYPLEHPVPAFIQEHVWALC